MSGTKHLRVEANERVDLSDFDFAVDDGLSEGFENLVGQLLTDPEGQRAWILDGFLVDNSDGTPLGGVQVRSTRGRAILSRIEDGVVSYGIVTTQGDTSKTIDVSAFTSPGTYGVYIRFQFVDGNNESRAFWDSSSAEEFSQTVPTRRNANWSMRIESSNPGTEWFQIAEITLSGGVVNTLTDKRNFYFEGDIEHTYPSGWSTDSDDDGTINELPVVPITAATPTWPGGSGQTALVTISDTSDLGLKDFVRKDSDLRWYKITAITVNTDFTVTDVHGHGGTFPSGAGASSLQTHRSTDRANDGVKDVQTFTAAMRQCIEDIKGRGLRRWWERDIGGLNVGFDDDPAEDTLAIGDAAFFLQNLGTQPRLQFDSQDFIRFTRSTNSMNFFTSNNSRFVITDAYLEGAVPVNFIKELAIGYVDPTPPTDTVTIGDNNFGFDYSSMTIPKIFFDTIAGSEQGYITYTRASNTLAFGTSNADRLTIADGGLILQGGGFNIGTGFALANDVLQVGDATFQIFNTASVPTIAFDSSDDLTYDRTANELIGTFGGSRAFAFGANKTALVNQYCDGDTSLTNPTVYTPFASTYQFPANTIRVNSTIRITAYGEVSGVGSATAWSFRVSVGGTIFGVAVDSSPTINTRFCFDVTIRMHAIGGGGSGWYVANGLADASGNPLQLLASGTGPIATNLPVDVDVDAQATGGNGSDTVLLRALVVDISD